MFNNNMKSIIDENPGSVEEAATLSPGIKIGGELNSSGIKS